MKIGQKWPENEMQECKVIYSRTLSGLLPRLHENPNYRRIVFEGKHDLGKNLVRKMRGYNVPIHGKTITYRISTINQPL